MVEDTASVGGRIFEANEKSVAVFPSIAEADAGYDILLAELGLKNGGSSGKHLDLRKQFVEGPLAMFVVPGTGISFCGHTADFVAYLEHPSSLRGQDLLALTNTLFTSLHPVCVEYLFANYPVEEHLGWEGWGIDIRKYWKWLSGSFAPDCGGKERPWMGLAR